MPFIQNIRNIPALMRWLSSNVHHGPPDARDSKETERAYYQTHQATMCPLQLHIVVPFLSSKCYHFGLYWHASLLVKCNSFVVCMGQPYNFHRLSRSGTASTIKMIILFLGARRPNSRAVSKMSEVLQQMHQSKIFSVLDTLHGSDSKV